MSFKGFKRYAAIETSVILLNNFSLPGIPLSLNAVWHGAMVSSESACTGAVRWSAFLKSIIAIFSMFSSIFLYISIIKLPVILLSLSIHADRHLPSFS